MIAGAATIIADEVHPIPVPPRDPKNTRRESEVPPHPVQIDRILINKLFHTYF